MHATGAKKPKPKWRPQRSIPDVRTVRLRNPPQKWSRRTYCTCTLYIHCLKGQCRQILQLLIDYYRNINVETIESNAVQHISSFLKTYQITSNIIDLFGDNSIIDEIQNENQHDPPHADDSIIILRNDTDTIKQDIIRIQKDIQYIKDDMDAKFDKIFIILSNLQ